jgi:hypothetical protein
MSMRRRLSAVLALALLAGCGHEPAPRAEPMVYDVAYGVALDPGDLGGYTVKYTGDDGTEQSETVPAGQTWGHRSRITSAPDTYVQLEVLLQPAAYPDGYPGIHCRVDVDNVMIGGQDSKRPTCRAGASDSEIKQKLAGSTKRSPGPLPTALR